MQTGKEDVKWSQFVDAMILYIEKPKDATKNQQSSSMIFVKLQDTNLIHRNWLYVYILTTKDQKQKYTYLRRPKTCTLKTIKC